MTAASERSGAANGGGTATLAGQSHLAGASIGQFVALEGTVTAVDYLCCSGEAWLNLPENIRTMFPMAAGWLRRTAITLPGGLKTVLFSEITDPDLVPHSVRNSVARNPGRFIFPDPTTAGANAGQSTA